VTSTTGPAQEAWRRENKFRSVPRLFAPSHVSDRNQPAKIAPGEAEMSEVEDFDDEAMEPGLSASEIQDVAKRQFVASAAVAVVIAVGAALMALTPAPRTTTTTVAVSQKFAIVQQPMFVAPRVASAKPYALELP
jgi:hypothetical protein